MDVDQESISSKKQKASDCFSVCSLRGIDDLRGKISEQIFARNFNYNFFFSNYFSIPEERGGGGGREVAFCLWFMSVNCFLLKCWRHWLP